MPSNTPNIEPSLPALRRDIEAFPIEHEGKSLFLLRDLEGLSEEPMAISAGGLLAASLMDGRRTASEVQALFAKTTGTFLQASDINRIIEQLDKSSFLENPAVQSKRAQILKDFLESPVRKAIHQGKGYPEDKLKLAAFLGGFFHDPHGPGKPLPDHPSAPAAPLGLISPHIDFPRGGPAYAWAYQALADSPPPDVIVAMGVAHVSPPSPWVMTLKDYETPYGALSVDKSLYNEIQERLWYDPRDDEWVHRTEHSLEFQAVWLKFLWREKTPSWVPILCSGFERFCPDRSPSTVSTVEEGLRKIGEALAARTRSGQKILVLAGVDLAHVGPRFGDQITLGPEVEKKIESEDRGSLERALRLEADPFYLSVIADNHWRHVCGLSALYTALRWIKMMNGDRPADGRLLAYGQAPDPLGGIVSFASGIFPRH
jgi:AmmeMemoRadiSam system protein B